MIRKPTHAAWFLTFCQSLTSFPRIKSYIDESIKNSGFAVSLVASILRKYNPLTPMGESIADLLQSVINITFNEFSLE